MIRTLLDAFLANAERELRTQREFLEVDQELYLHEQPFYRYCASGAGANPADDPDWVAKRERLTREWQQLCPYAQKP